MLCYIYIFHHMSSSIPWKGVRFRQVAAGSTLKEPGWTNTESLSQRFNLLFTSVGQNGTEFQNVSENDGEDRQHQNLQNLMGKLANLIKCIVLRSCFIATTLPPSNPFNMLLLFHTTCIQAAGMYSRKVAFTTKLNSCSCEHTGKRSRFQYIDDVRHGSWLGEGLGRLGFWNITLFQQSHPCPKPCVQNEISQKYYKNMINMISKSERHISLHLSSNGYPWPKPRGLKSKGIRIQGVQGASSSSTSGHSSNEVVSRENERAKEDIVLRLLSRARLFLVCSWHYLAYFFGCCSA